VEGYIDGGIVAQKSYCTATIVGSGFPNVYASRFFVKLLRAIVGSH